MAGAWQQIGSRRFYVGDDTNETAIGSAEPETLLGRLGDDALDGEGGDDAVDGGHGSDILHGGAGNDRLWDWDGSAPPGQSLIGRDRLFGDDGDDHLNIWSPDTGDVADGGAGTDTLEIRFNYPSNTPIQGNPPIVFALISGGSSVVRLNNVNTVAVNNIEKLLFVGNSGFEFITGGSFDDTLAGNGGDDVLRGGDGNDRLEAGTGIVNLDGGNGTDTANFDLGGATTGITVRNDTTINLGIHGIIRRVEILSDIILGSGNDRVILTQAVSASVETRFGNDTVTATGPASVEAGYGNDVVTLGDGDDFVDPGNGADLVRLGGGNDQLDNTATGSRANTDPDTVFGEDGNDAIYTAAGDDVLDGGRGNDSIFGGGGADRITAGEGNDSVNAEAGADLVRGGDGNDTLTTDYDYWTGDTPSDDDAAYGDAGNDSITGGYGADTLDGGLGDDTVSPGFRIYDGPGLQFDPLADRIMGGAGNDVLKLGGLISGGETHTLKVRIGGATTHVEFNGATIGSAVGFEALDVSVFGDGGHSISGGAHADRIVTGNGNDSLSGGGGNDTIDASYRGADTVLAGAGNDNVTLSLDRTDRVLLGDGDDLLTAYGIYASDPAPVPGGRLDGGLGFDTLVLSGGGRGVSFDGVRLFIEGVAIATVAGFERVRFNGTATDERIEGGPGEDVLGLGGGADSADGGAGADSLDGAAGNDLLEGGDGNDSLNGGAGANTLLGGDGDDLLLLGADAPADSVHGGAGFDTLLVTGTPAGVVTMAGSLAGLFTVAVGGVTAITGAGIEAIGLAGGTGNDSLFGGNQADTLDGGAGADTLRGFGGDDLLVSGNGQGPDRLDGGLGDDTARLNRSSSTANFLVATGGTQTLADGTVLLGIERLDMRGGSGNDTLLGGALNDTLAGNGGADSLAGGDGNDSIETGFSPGADSVSGGAGNDTVTSFLADAYHLSGDAGAADLLILSRFVLAAGIALDLGSAAVQALPDGTVLAGFEQGIITGGGGGDSLAGGALDDQLTGSNGDDRLAGAGGLDSLTGDAGADTILGGAGADTLSGGAGDDVLTGGADADRFRFDNPASGGADLVTDFAADDVLRIQRAGFGGTLAAGVVPTLVSGVNPAAPAGSGLSVFLYDTATGALGFDADGDIAGAPVVFARLFDGGVPALLTAAQILVE